MEECHVYINEPLNAAGIVAKLWNDRLFNKFSYGGCKAIADEMIHYAACLGEPSVLELKRIKYQWVEGTLEELLKIDSTINSLEKMKEAGKVLKVEGTTNYLWYDYRKKV